MHNAGYAMDVLLATCTCALLLIVFMREISLSSRIARTKTAQLYKVKNEVQLKTM